MKTKSILYPIFMTTATLLFLSNCGGKNESSEATDEHAAHTEAAVAEPKISTPQFQVDATFQKQLASVFTAYVALKDAFVASDASKVKTEAVSTAKALEQTDMTLLTGAAHNDWMTYLTPLQTSLKEIQSAADIEAQRKAFSTVSDNLYKSIKAFGLGGTEAYYEFCPMAFNNEGAYWLSQEDKIRNPYFGDEMLTCGEVKEKLR